MSVSTDGWNHGADLDGASPSGPVLIRGGYIRVSPTNIESFTISTNVGILTQADFILTGTYYEYYNANLISIQSASSTGYTVVINKTTSHGDLIFEVAFHLTRLYAWTDPSASTGETLYAWTCDQDGIYVGPNQVHTIYTKTNTIDTSSDIFYLEDGTEISLSELIYGSTIGDSIISADANRIQIDFAT